MDSGGSSGSVKALLDVVRKMLRGIQPQRQFGLSFESRLDRDPELDSPHLPYLQDTATVHRKRD